ncbi:hypothetical protein BDR07DRAFT_249434 [Suillus spraguei]|nr:hypothetical protein BDR07DRAFT_249434 [Suillus spraguei]
MKPVCLDFISSLLGWAIAQTNFCDAKCYARKMQSAVRKTSRVRVVKLIVKFQSQIHSHCFLQRRDSSLNLIFIKR